MLTSSGFKRLRTADYLPVIQEQARELFGEDADLSDRTPLGKFIYLQAQQRAEDNEQLEQVYNSRFVDTSEGATLEANVKRALITKKKSLKASGEVVFNLNKNTQVPIGTLVRTAYNVYFKTLEAIQSVEAGDYRVGVEALEYGIIGNVEPNEIVVIANPMNGINSVTNPEAFLNGQDEESDEELQDRYYDSLGKIGARRIESIEANVLDNVDGVRSCRVIENDTMEIDADGRPPKSFETVVLGGLDEPIAQEIKRIKPGGIQPYGTTVVTLTDDRGITHEIGFTRASTVNIYVRAFIKKSNQFPLNGEELVKQQIVRYIGGTYGNTVYDGVGMSENVILARCESRLFAIEGLVDVRVELSADGIIYGQENINIGFPEVAETDVSKIEVMDLV
ncbi:baseplate J/gp47 family protein [Lysinibacillus boronitolerans]|uniref:baseplate J/gp47 family protein n=1 Tax=Lysinibacillus boronitolerans TaxID=309788 RepID=UPI003854644E